MGVGLGFEKVVIVFRTNQTFNGISSEGKVTIENKKRMIDYDARNILLIISIPK